LAEEAVAIYCFIVFTRKQSVKMLDTDGGHFKCICSKFPTLIQEKVREEVLVGSQIRKLTFNESFEGTVR
jgi:hypothetical protein